jgi:hypothetical protein
MNEAGAKNNAACTKVVQYCTSIQPGLNSTNEFEVINYYRSLFIKTFSHGAMTTLTPHTIILVSLQYDGYSTISTPC